jgi:hypothetical protein
MSTARLPCWHGVTIVGRKPACADERSDHRGIEFASVA